MKNFSRHKGQRKIHLLSANSLLWNALGSGRALERIYHARITFMVKQLRTLLNLAQEYKVPVNKVPVAKTQRL